MPSPVYTYVKALQKEVNSGRAREHAYRPALKALVEALNSGVAATNEPARVQCGAPDFIVQSGKTPIGYIECKDLGASLDAIETSEQLKRYRTSLANLILTNYTEFRYYVQGEPRMAVRLASVDAKDKVKRHASAEKPLRDMFATFFGAQWPAVAAPSELAARLARLAQLIRDTIASALEHEQESGRLHQQFEGFRDALLHNLTRGQFADMYAQTICYGLFAARCIASPGESLKFTRQHAAYDLPKTNPFLRTMFNHIAGPDLDDRVAWVVDGVAELLRRSDIESILETFGAATRREDPVVHFYETFLAEYDRAMRETRGVYYTPEPVVDYIVRSVDRILKTDFDLPRGLADNTKVEVRAKDPHSGRKEKRRVHKVQILDPAAGTGTFLHAVIQRIHETFKGNEGAWSSYVPAHLLPRLFGFELLMAPYAVAHMKLGLLLQETGYDFGADERLRVYMTNTLDEAEHHAASLFAALIAEEANQASRVKRDAPVMVVLGNPPYSGHSANKGPWIKKLIDDYKKVDGKPLGERNPKWLNDDYVKFIRFAQWRIERTGYGVLAFVTNHGYLDNPTFRGMRQSLMATFDEIYILDLHGNSKKKETAPDGGKDENVFDIQQGVAIAICVKKTLSPPSPREGAATSPPSSREGAGGRADKGTPSQAGPPARGASSAPGVPSPNPLPGGEGYSSPSLREGAGGRADKGIPSQSGPPARDARSAPGDPSPNPLPGGEGCNSPSLREGIGGRAEKGRRSQAGSPAREARSASGVPSPNPLPGGEGFAASVFHADLYGLRKDKYAWLNDHDLCATDWCKISPESPFYLFTPYDNQRQEEFRGFPSIQAIAPVSSVGVVTGQDANTIAFDEHAALELAKTNELSLECVTKLSYRPFDTRYITYDGKVVTRPRAKVMSHMLAGENLGILYMRQVALQEAYSHFGITRHIVDNRCFYSNKGITSLAPLYLYPTASKGQQDFSSDGGPWEPGEGGRVPNLAPEFVEMFAEKLGLEFVSDGQGDLEKTFGPEDVLHYIYAVFHSPSYRERYAEFLKMDFPRVPLTSDTGLFRRLCALGRELTGLHLLEKVPAPICGFPVPGDNVVARPLFTVEEGVGEGRSWINKAQYFEGVPEDVWGFRVGGYQVCDKWLKDRKGRALAYDDIEHYRKVVTALAETLRVMVEIDDAIGE